MYAWAWMGLLMVALACQEKAPAVQVEVPANKGADLTRHEAAITAFEAADADSMPPKEAILFVGSSSIRFWETLAEDMAPLPVINRGFGGSTFPELLHYMDRIVLPYQPKAIILYEGDNDIVDDSMSTQMVLENLQEFERRVAEKMPEVKIWFISIKPSIARRHLLDKLRETNRLVKAYIDSKENLEYIDLATPMMDESGENIRPEIFISDSLHMNALGYQNWATIVKYQLMAAYGPTETP
ncbi:MAG: SGNH/GDSL hydrolase family protein [Bacteroidota bacterium]